MSLMEYLALSSRIERACDGAVPPRDIRAGVGDRRGLPGSRGGVRASPATAGENAHESHHGQGATRHARLVVVEGRENKSQKTCGERRIGSK